MCEVLPLSFESPESYRGGVLLRVRFWLYRALPFLGRWSELAPACCGTCPTCLGATATGATVTWLGALRRSDSD